MASEDPRGQRAASAASVDEDDDIEAGKANGFGGMVAPMVDAAAGGVSQLMSLLAAKEHEQRVLQKTHDEYVKSSCEYEKELEGELERCEKKSHELEVSMRSLEENKTQLQVALAQTQSELEMVVKREAVLVSQTEEMKWKIQRLEQTNDELETATRVAQASIDELQHRVETLTEENVFLLQEKEDTAAAAAASTQGEEPTKDASKKEDAEDDEGHSSSAKAPEQRRSSRYPEVVESCLHMTCTSGKCQRTGLAHHLATRTANTVLEAKKPPRKSLLERIRRWLCARS